MKIETLTFDAFAKRYCDNVNPTENQLQNWNKKWGLKPKPEALMSPEKLRGVLRLQKDSFHPTGWMLFECHDMSSSHMGELTIVPYGPNNTFKELPAFPISPRGLASDMSVVVALLPASEVN
jgi:hypothetical protein